MFRHALPVAASALAIALILSLAGCSQERTWTASTAKATLLSAKMDAVFAKKAYEVALTTGTDGQPLKVVASTAGEQSKLSSGAHATPAKCIDAFSYAVSPTKDADSSDPFFTSRKYKAKSYDGGGGNTDYKIRVFENASAASAFMKYAVQIRKECASSSVTTADGQHLTVLTAMTAESGDTAFSDQSSVTGSSSGDISNLSSSIRSGNIVVSVSSSGNAQEGKAGVVDFTAMLAAAAK